MKSPYWVAPLEANLLITGKCNLQCKHCSVSSYGDLTKDLPLSEWVNILDELKHNKVIKLTITGGEPLARPDFTEFLGEVYKRPFRFSINTNATLITPDIIQALKKYSGRINELMISLDGPDEFTIDEQRGKGVYKNLIKGVSLLAETNIPFGFYCTTTSINVDKLNETAKLALSLKGDWIKFNNFLYAGPLLNNKMVPKQDDVNKAADKLSILAAKHPNRILGTLLDMREVILKHKNNQLEQTNNKAYSCGAGIHKIAIFPDGRVTPCDHLPDLTLGNITKSSLEAIIKGKEMQDFTAFMNQKRSDYKECTGCKYLEFCLGGCPVEALEANKKIGIDRHSCLKQALGEL